MIYDLFHYPKAMKLKVIDHNKADETITIPDKIINQPTNPRFMAQVIRVYEANRRQDTRHTKTRGEVSGGGRKPWRQKGTGRARQGSIRSPQWVGGGVVFGPRKNQNHALELPVKMRKKALQISLLDKIRHQAVTVVSSTNLKKISTKEAHNWLKSIQPPSGQILIVSEKSNPTLALSTRNIPGVENIDIQMLNAYEIIAHSRIILEKGVLAKILGILLEKEKLPADAGKKPIVSRRQMQKS
jgi:large subunit ribosomal protein L4